MSYVHIKYNEITHSHSHIRRSMKIFLNNKFGIWLSTFEMHPNNIGFWLLCTNEVGFMLNEKKNVESSPMRSITARYRPVNYYLPLCHLNTHAHIIKRSAEKKLAHEKRKQNTMERLPSTHINAML